MSLRVIAFLVALGFAFSAIATDSLYFQGGGYTIQVSASQDLNRQPVVSDVAFASARSTNLEFLRMPQVRVERFDPAKRLLTLQFTSGPEAGAVPSFTLSVVGTKAELRINGAVIWGKFDWTV